MASLETDLDLMETVDAPVCVVDSGDLEVVRANDSFVELLGLEDAVEGERFTDLASLSTEAGDVERVILQRSSDTLSLETSRGEHVEASVSTLDDDQVVVSLLEGPAERFLKEVSRMLHAETVADVERCLRDTTESSYVAASLYSYEDGTLTSEDGKVVDKEAPAWLAFTSNEVRLTELSGSGVDDSWRYGTATAASVDTSEEESDTGVPAGGVRLDVPLMKSKVLSVEFDQASRYDLDAVVTLVEVAETAVERLRMEGETENLERRLSETKEVLRTESRFRQLLTGVMEDVREFKAKDDVTRSLCKRLLAVDGWEFAWIVEMDEEFEVSCICDGVDSRDSFVHRVSDSYTEETPTADTLLKGESIVVDDVGLEPASSWRRTVLNAGYLSVASVPVAHGKRKFGSLEVYSDEAGRFDDRSLEVLEETAGLLAFAFVSAEQTQSLLSEDFQRLTLKIDPDSLNCYFSHLVEKLHDEVRITSVVPESGSTLVYFDTDADGSEVVAASEEIGVSVEREKNGYAAKVSGVSLVEEAMEVGGRVSSYSFQDPQIHVDVNLPREVDANELLKVVREKHPEAELAARKYSFDEFTLDSVLEDLTDRQETVLRLAYDEGFFESPRERTGDEIAEELGITATTFHQHLRSAEQTLVSSLLDGDAEK